MTQIRVISFDLEGTLVTPRFSDMVWNSGIPRLYSEANGITLEEADNYVLGAYQEVGEGRLEWYDIKYWFNRFRLTGYLNLLNRLKGEISCYEDAEPSLAHLQKKYKLVIASSSAREFMNLLLESISGYFSHTFSSISDFRSLKTPEFYLQICDALGVTHEEIVHVGDNRDFDYLAPSSVGITAFHLDRQAKRAKEPTVKDLRQFASKIETLARR